MNSGSKTHYGYAGKILYVDLSKGEIKPVPISRDLTDRFIGGRGVNMKILFDEVDAGIDGMSPENPLILGTGPMGGTLMGSRVNSTSISPMTHFLADSNSGGHGPAEIKFAGYDHIVIKGKADKPVYLCINNDEVEIRDAEDLWGLDFWQTTDRIREKLNDRSVQVFGIGQAGEKLVKVACLLNSYTRANGHTNHGCLMGSKNLKAIAVKGSLGVKIARPKEYLELMKELFQRLTTHPVFQVMPKYGTPFLVDYEIERGILATKFWNDSTVEGIDKLRCEEWLQNCVVKSRACYGCFSHCDHFFNYKGIKGPGVEMSSITAFGLKLGAADWETILKCHNLVNQYGMDTASVSNSIGLAMDLYESGTITKKDTDGLEMTFGNLEVIEECVHRIGKQEGDFAKLMGKGPYLMAQEIGGEAPGRVIHSKKLDGTGEEWRVIKEYALAFATSTIGATHLRSMPYIHDNEYTLDRAAKKFGNGVRKPLEYDADSKSKAVRFFAIEKALIDSFELCMSGAYGIGLPIGPEDWIKLYNAATGIDMSLEDAWTAAERVYLLEMAINIKQGFKTEDDHPPERMLKEPVKTGPYKGQILELKPYLKMLRSYYKEFGCDENTGIPTREKLTEIGLPEAVDELERLGKFNPPEESPQEKGKPTKTRDKKKK